MDAGGNPTEIRGDLAGRLIVATPVIGDGNFDRTVVLVLTYSRDEGALGVVINRPGDNQLILALPGWSDIASHPAVVFEGGPVSPSTAIAVAACTNPEGVDVDPIGSLGLFTVDLDADPALVSSSLSDLRIFAGYAGWAPGQLEAEARAGAWFALDAQVSDLTTNEPESLWERVLNRQANDVRFFAGYPADPGLN